MTTTKESPKLRRQFVTNAFPEELSEGYRAFYFSHLRRERERYEQLAESGQKPQTMIIACCDSRAGPETIFDAVPGQFFIVRNVANVMPPFEPSQYHHGTSAALEFAVQELRVKHILVMGHGRCGGVTAFRKQMEGSKSEPLSPGDFIGRWIGLLKPVAQDIRCDDPEAEAARQKAFEEANVRNSIQNLKSFPCVKILLERKQIALHGAWFDIATGELSVMDPESGDFVVCNP